MKILEENSQIVSLNEMIVKSHDSLPQDIENSIYYGRLRTLLHSEIINFCKEQLELKQDLNVFRMNVGQELSESEIREYLDGLKLKFNNIDSNVGIDYHIEVTRLDYGVPVFVIIKRKDILMKKFVFRFRKADISGNLLGLSTGSTPLSSLKKENGGN